MPILIDTNCFANVFSRSSQHHLEFKPVLDWIIKGQGLWVGGGSKYKNELSKTKYLKIYLLLKDSKKVLEGNTQSIDSIQEIVANKIVDVDFDDPHIPAIILDTKCRLICSKDTRSIKFVTNPDLYPTGFKRPAYYTGKSNADLLCDHYIDDRLKPLCKLNKEQIERLEVIASRFG